MSESHVAKLAQSFNPMAASVFPGKYQSDLAVQVTSPLPEAQQFTANFVNNKVMGSGNFIFIPVGKSSNARVCPTVGTMTSGYDCSALLNPRPFRPVLSPADFIQIKERGTRKHDFRKQVFEDALRKSTPQPHHTAFNLFDFSDHCEYFEAESNHDEGLRLRARTAPITKAADARLRLCTWARTSTSAPASSRLRGKRPSATMA